MVLSMLAAHVNYHLLTALIPFPYSEPSPEWKHFEKIVVGGFVVVRTNTLLHQPKDTHTFNKLFPGENITIFMC
jgi:hypothetical protein